MLAKLKQNLEKCLTELSVSEIAPLRESLTENYKQNSGQGKSLINSKKESLTYALCRMPATIEVVYSLFSTLSSQGFLKDIHSAIDVGAGTGAVYFALKEFDSQIQVSSFERDDNMIAIFERLTDGEKISKFDILNSSLNESADIVISSYMLSELDDEGRSRALKVLFEASKKYVLIIDTGTPKTYKDFMKLRAQAEGLGLKTIAPCVCETCPLEEDYCQFFARVERSSVLRRSKGAVLPYEDEKYFYLLFEKTDRDLDRSFSRVIRRPKIEKSLVKLTLCSKSGVKTEVFTKKLGEVYKRARKIKINEIL